jgi:hypothetical protein
MQPAPARRRTPLLAVVVLAALAALLARAASASSSWEGWSFLLGEWEGQGAVGGGKGSFTFALDLQDKVLVRRNHAELPGNGQVQGVVHDDLMVVYRDEKGEARADYFDNEGHVIRYQATLAPDGKTLVFLSEGASGQPGFRLTYTRKDDGSLGIRFEVAPPGRGNNFQTYLEGTAIKRGSPAHP